jgi:hypothetical protein
VGYEGTGKLSSRTEGVGRELRSKQMDLETESWLSKRLQLKRARILAKRVEISGKDDMKEHM